MKIKVCVKEGLVAFACNGVLTEPVRKVILNRPSRTFHMVFDWSGSEIELDCPLDEEAAAAITKPGQCGIGFYAGDKMLGAKFVPLEFRE